VPCPLANQAFPRFDLVNRTQDAPKFRLLAVKSVPQPSVFDAIIQIRTSCLLLFFFARRRSCSSCLSSQRFLHFAVVQNQEKQEELAGGRLPSNHEQQYEEEDYHKNFNYRPSLLFIVQCIHPLHRSCLLIVAPGGGTSCFLSLLSTTSLPRPHTSNRLLLLASISVTSTSQYLLAPPGHDYGSSKRRKR
jgi:hypothetical protein